MNKKVLLILILLFVVLIVLQHHVPRPVDWDLSFSENHKKPYGCSVIKELLSDVFPCENIEVNHASFFMSLKENQHKDQNLIIICDQFNPDNLDLNAFLEFVALGNSAFLSSLSISEDLLDTLGLIANEALMDTSFLKKAPEHLLLNYIDESDSSYLFVKRMPEHYLISNDSTAVRPLGYDKSGRLNFVSRRFGKGVIFLHCQPLAFTNFHILYGNADYACSALSVLPVTNIIWDQYYKPNKPMDTSPVRYILSNPALKSAWYVALATLAIYLIFGSKRLQRPVPVIPPPVNSSLYFLKSVGKLYYRSHNHEDLAKKKILFFRDFLKTRYNLKISFSPENIQLLHEKSGADSALLEKLFITLSDTENKEYITKNDLFRLQQEVEAFYKTCK